MNVDQSLSPQHVISSSSFFGNYLSVLCKDDLRILFLNIALFMCPVNDLRLSSVFDLLVPLFTRKTIQ